MNGNSLFSGSIVCWVRSDILGTDSPSARCTVTTKGSCTEAVRRWEGKLLVPGAGRVHGEGGDGEARGGLAMRWDEDCMWMGAMPWRGGRAYASSFGTGRAGRSAVGGGGLRGSRRTRARTGPGIGGLGEGVVDGMMVGRWRSLTW